MMNINDPKTTDAPIISDALIARNMRLNGIINLVLEKLNEQHAQYNLDHVMEHTMVTTILGEEYGEVCRAVLELHRQGRTARARQDYINELVDVASFAIAALNSYYVEENIDGNMSISNEVKEVFYKAKLSPFCYSCRKPNADAEFYIEPNGTRVGVCKNCGSPFASDHKEFEHIVLHEIRELEE